MKLATRTFLWALLPFAVLLIGSFWVVQDRVLLNVRQGLKASVQQAQASMASMRSPRTRCAAQARYAESTPPE